MIGVSSYWQITSDGDSRLLGHYLAHYSSKKARVNMPPPYYGAERLCIGPGQKMALLLPDNGAAFAWRRADYRDDGQEGIECTLFRNVSEVLSSELIREADTLAFQRWPGERHFTFVDPTEVRRKRDPGRCFVRAGWTRLKERTQRGLVILELLA